MSWRIPRWPAPPRVRAAYTTRQGGVSAGPYAGFNLAEHVGDDPSAVAANRARLRAGLGLPAEPAWLRQVHGAAVVEAVPGPPREADGSLCRGAGQVSAVLTADCLPVLLCDRAGTVACALHAGWRGLAAGILEAGVAATGRPPGALLAWLGPAIGPAAFRVGEEVRAAFLDRAPEDADAFAPAAGGWRADLRALARRRLSRAGVTAVYGVTDCTYSEPDLYYSYRRDRRCGRQATLIWLA